MSIMLLMVLMAVSVFSVNYYTATQQRMTMNHQAAVQEDFRRGAVLQESLWQVLSNPCYRTVAAGETYTFDGADFNRKILNSSLTNHEDVVLFEVMSQGSTQSLNRGYRYFCDAVTGEVEPQPGVTSGFNKPEGIALDADGNLFIADKENNRIVIRDSDGNLTLFAGTETAGYSGDGGLATSAMLNKPAGVCVDPTGNVYIADTENHRIRMVDSSGMITTVAGTGTAGYAVNGGYAVNAELNTPNDLFYHAASDSLYIADKENSCIRQINSSGIITTIAGTPEVAGDSGDDGDATLALLNTPRGIFVTPAGVLYIADTENSRIRKVESDIITTVAGSSQSGFKGDDGDATSARLDTPWNIALDTSGNLYIADTGNHRIRRVCGSDGIIQTIAGGLSGFTDNVEAVEAQFDTPSAIALPSILEGKTFFVSDKENSTIRIISFEIDDRF